LFVVRFSTAHGKWNVFAMRLVLAHGKEDEQTNGVNGPWKKNICRAPKKSTANYFTGCREKCARQNSSLQCARDIRTTPIRTRGNHRFSVVPAAKGMLKGSVVASLARTVVALAGGKEDGL
jgi:hypothetical protein